MIGLRKGASGDSKAYDLRNWLKAELKLDDLNIEYFLMLYGRFTNPSAKVSLEIFDPDKINEHAKDKQIAYPTAIAPSEMLQKLPYVRYQDLAAHQDIYTERAREALLWIKKMQAGTGSSMTRTTYLAQVRGALASQITIGAKGTDLYVEKPGEMKISLAEAQILQALHEAAQKVFAEVALQDIVSSETEESLAAIWKARSPIDPAKSYEQLVQSLPNVQKSGRSYQSYIPTIDEHGEISLNRLAPGGHALFAVDALRAAYIDDLRPRSKQHGREIPVISVLGNGEDLSSSPDSLMIGWALANQVPIVMVTTEKTENDLKGGQIALVKTGEGRIYCSIVEQAQAKEAGQIELFEQLGLRPKDNVAFFNTNMAIFNYEALRPKIKRLVAEIGEEEFMRIIAPDLILNKKSQVDNDGVQRSYTQLEGAMGSSLLRLDRHWRERYGEALVHFINVDREARTRFFSPIKTAFDFFMQFHSDRFGFDRKSMRLVNHRPGVLPSVALSDQTSGGRYWADVENVLRAFAGASIIGLDRLEVEGRVSFRGVTLRGDVKVVNNSDKEIDLTTRLGTSPPVLENTTLVF